MSGVLAVALGVVLHEVVRTIRPRWALAAAGLVVAALWQPLPVGALVAAGAALFGRRRLAGRRREALAADADVVVLGELTALGLSAGLPFAAALDRAADEVADDLAAEVRGVLRRVRQSGAAGVLTLATGRAQRLYVLAGRASTSGASVRSAVQAFVDERRDEVRATELAAARKLPVRLIFPLALLILPGFTVLIVGPAVLGALERLAL